MFGTARRVLATVGAAAIGASLLTIGGSAAGASPTAGIPSLSLNRAYTTAPFAGTSTTAKGQEGSAYVASDNALWMVDASSAYEIDASSDALRRVIPTADFTNALPVGGVGTPAGTTRSLKVASVLMRLKPIRAAMKIHTQMNM